LAWEKLARLPKASGKGFLKKSEDDMNGIWSTKRVRIISNT
jgi:translation initiation factor 2-alpha kinase 4